MPQAADAVRQRGSKIGAVAEQVLLFLAGWSGAGRHSITWLAVRLSV